MHIVALIANILGLSIAIIWVAKTNAYDAILAVIALTGSLPITLKNSVEKFTNQAMSRFDEPGDFVLLGKPATGKTVYLATVLNLLIYQSKSLVSQR